MAQLLLDRGANLDAVTHAGLTSLALAASHGRDSTVKLLLDRRANPEFSVTVNSAQGMMIEADATDQQALAGYEKALGPEHTSTLSAVYNHRGLAETRSASPPSGQPCLVLTDASTRVSTMLSCVMLLYPGLDATDNSPESSLRL